jgi:hypothetical protein
MRSKSEIEKFFSLDSSQYVVDIESEGYKFKVHIYSIDYDDDHKTTLRSISRKVDAYFHNRIPKKELANRFLAEYKDKVITEKMISY